MTFVLTPGDLIKISYTNGRLCRLDHEGPTFGIFVSSRGLKWGDDYFRYKMITPKGIEEILVWDGDRVEIINETR